MNSREELVRRVTYQAIRISELEADKDIIITALHIYRNGLFNGMIRHKGDNMLQDKAIRRHIAALKGAE